jgi:hypothetical protein
MSLQLVMEDKVINWLLVDKYLTKMECSYS